MWAVSWILHSRENTRVLFTIEAAGTTVEGRIEPVEMVGRADYKQTIIALEAIKLVEEERAVAIIDEGVEIFKDEDAWCHLPCFIENVLHRGFLSGPSPERLHIQRGMPARIAILHNGLHSDCLAVPWVDNEQMIAY